MPKLKEEEKLINIKVNKNFHYKLKLQALKENTTMQRLIINVMDKYISQEENNSDFNEFNKKNLSRENQESKTLKDFKTIEEIRENFAKQEEDALKKLLSEGYVNTKIEDGKTNKEWEAVTLENWHD